MDWQSLVASRSTTGCKEVLSDDCSASAAFFAASLLCSNSFENENPLFEDGELLDFDALEAIVVSKAPDIDDDNLHRIYGLVSAVTGDAFFTHPDHFIRLCGAIVYGDPYYFDEEEPTLVQMVWAMFQVDMFLDESAEDLIHQSVADRIVEITEANPVDQETLQEIEPDFVGGIEEFYDELLRMRKAALRADLKKCGVDDETIAELDLGE